MNPYDDFNTDTSNDSSFSNNESTIAKLAVLSGFFSTLGDVISTYAAILALEDIQQSQNNNNNTNNNNNNNNNYEARIDELEKQIKYLTKEMNKQKKQK